MRTDEHAKPLAGAAQQLMASFGVAPVEEHDTVTDVLQRRLDELGHKASVARLRYGVLHLSCDATTAGLLRFDRDRLLSELDAAAPGQVIEVRFRVTPDT